MGRHNISKKKTKNNNINNSIIADIVYYIWHSVISIKYVLI